MPLKTFALIAAAGAATGAAATTAYFTTTRRERIQPTPTPTTPSTHSAILSTPAAIPPSSDPSPAILFQTTTTPTTTTQPIPPLPPVDPNGLFQYGFPGPISDIRPAPSLTSSFDRRTRNPHWVAEHITPASLSTSSGDRRHSAFTEDTSLPPMFRARLADYARSGYDRGHQVPAADAKWSQAAMDATFALSNMCPQVGDGFNRDYWAHLEDFCRRLTARYPSVRVVTGPLYLPRRDPADGKWRVSYEVIGSPPNVAVPTHFFKVVFAEDGRKGGVVSLGAFVLPNAPIENSRPLKDFEVPLEIVERASGLEFATKLPAARRRKLCAEVDCSLVVKEYAERQRSFGAGTGPPAPKPASGLLR